MLASAQRFGATFGLVARCRHETKAFLRPRIFTALCREASHVSIAQAHSAIPLPPSILLATQRHSWTGLSGLPPLRHSVRKRRNGNAPNRACGVTYWRDEPTVVSHLPFGEMEKGRREAALGGKANLLRCSFQHVHRSADLLLSCRQCFANVSFRDDPELVKRVRHGVPGDVQLISQTPESCARDFRRAGALCRYVSA